MKIFSAHWIRWEQGEVISVQDTHTISFKPSSSPTWASHFSRTRPPQHSPTLLSELGFIHHVFKGGSHVWLLNHRSLPPCPQSNSQRDGMNITKNNVLQNFFFLHCQNQAHSDGTIQITEKKTLRGTIQLNPCSLLTNETCECSTRSSRPG